jgi:hypothetical protein
LKFVIIRTSALRLFTLELNHRFRMRQVKRSNSSSLSYHVKF